MKNLIKELLDKNQKNKIIVNCVGDIAIDEYFEVKIERFSPEESTAYVMNSLDNQPQTVFPGMAGNVAKQLNNLNTDVRLFGMMDEYAESVLIKNNIYVNSCLNLSNGQRNPVKKRFYKENRQFVRWDVEKPFYGIKSENELRLNQKYLLKKLLSSNKADITIFSDYDKGMFTNGKSVWREFLLNKNNKTIIDPKRGPIKDWGGCFIFKPNSKEAYELSGGITDWKQQCDYFQAEIKCNSVIITKSGEGIVGKIENNYFEYNSKNVVSSQNNCGAGDFYSAVLAICVAHEFPVKESAMLAHEAGKVYVGENYNKNINLLELTRWI